MCSESSPSPRISTLATSAPRAASSVSWHNGSTIWLSRLFPFRCELAARNTSQHYGKRV
uniref:Uncharacterized protein n=1 Tax=Anopheles minimus TaxID=112268 RepID=A0A182WPP2_9DIPT